MRILGISGSLREGSYNTKALRVAASLAPSGAEITMADLSAIPPYNEDVRAKGFPPAVETLRTAIRGADALLIVTPEYNYSTSGVLKNAIDWASRPPDQPFDGKPIALMGASAGRFGTARAQYHLRQTFVFLNGHILNKPEVMIGTAQNVFDDAGNITDETTRDLVGQLVAALVEWAKKMG